jgi:hypothetical protein
MRRLVIERDIPQVGSFEPEHMKGAAARSTEMLAQRAPEVQPFLIYFAADTTFIDPTRAAA